jgi:putative two-component system response regulator
MNQGWITATEATPPAAHLLESKPHWVAEAKHLNVVNSACQQLYRVLDDFALVCRERQQAVAALGAARHEPLWRLALGVGCRNKASPARVLLVGVYAALLADALGWSVTDCNALQQAAPLCDVGMLGMLDELAPMARVFSADERALLHTHPMIGAEMLGSGLIPELRLAAEVALSHHEQFDGKGYPVALQGQQIPLSGRIAAVAVYFAGLTSEKDYRTALPDDLVFDLAAAEAGARFDPQVIDALLHLSGLLGYVRRAVYQLSISLASPAPDRDLWLQLKQSFAADSTAQKNFAHVAFGSNSWK